MTETAPVITVTNLIKQFGRFAALRGVTAEFSSGKLYAVLGDNGAGKTTLLRTLAGLLHPTTGKLDGPTIAEPKQRFKDLAFVPQDPASTLYKPTLEQEIRDVLEGTRWLPADPF